MQITHGSAFTKMITDCIASVRTATSAAAKVYMA
jgi:hypothetical protein